MDPLLNSTVLVVTISPLIPLLVVIIGLKERGRSSGGNTIGWKGSMISPTSIASQL